MKLDQARSGWRGAGSTAWSQADDAMLQEALALGFSAPGIGVLLGRSAGAVRLRRDKLQRLTREAADAERRASRRRTRPCMRCSNSFESEGSHNRMCNPCRAFANGLSPMAPDDPADDDAVDAASSDAHAAPPPGLPRIARASSAPSRARAAAARGTFEAPGRSKVAVKTGATAAPGTRVHRDHPDEIRISSCTQRAMNHD